MSSIIKLLPDSIANQIAAGEVIQRPASAVKELLENAIDSGSTSIKLIIKDAGKTLIQVIDNGCGMTPVDAELCFSRHATSKIRKIEDLSEVRTMGFRGEALSSIASIAQVDLKTRPKGEELGSLISIAGSKSKPAEACSCPEGTTISVKNLFFNVPARRNFLKTNSVETKHIIDEFQRVSLANPGLHMEFIHNGVQIYHLKEGNLRQRL
ncbi:MAG TPA: DNA mismatch repair protein MutL, partial [Bacteroidetes bacterium]|nr:DNA mismatch repair protein MutL [Bacteroidota bacterium]